MADKLSTARIASLERGASDNNSVGYADGIWSVPAAASPAGGRRFPDRPLVGIRVANQMPRVASHGGSLQY